MNKEVGKVCRTLVFPQKNKGSSVVQRFSCEATVVDEDNQELARERASNSGRALDITRDRIRLVPAFGALLDNTEERVVNEGVVRSKYCCAEPKSLAKAIQVVVDEQGDAGNIRNARLSNTVNGRNEVIPRCLNCEQWTPVAGENIVHE